jgi:hypothetical protein
MIEAPPMPPSAAKKPERKRDKARMLADIDDPDAGIRAHTDAARVLALLDSTDTRRKLTDSRECLDES